MKKTLPILYLIGLLILTFLAQLGLDRMQRAASATFNFTPLLVVSTLVNLVVMLLLLGLTMYLWSQPRDHRAAAWVFLLLGLLLPLLALVHFSGVLSLPNPLNLWFSQLVLSFWPLAKPGLVAAGAAAAGLLHLLLRRPGIAETQ